MTQQRVKPGWILLLLAYLGFISLGLPDAVLGVAWPGVRDAFALPQSGMGAILLAGGSGYFLSSFLTGRLLQLMTVGTLLFVSTVLVAAGLAGFAATPLFPWFLVCAVAVGLGSGAIDGALNSYASHNFAARHVNWLHAFYGVGATLGPAIMTVAMIHFGSWRLGYGSLHALLLAMALAFWATRRFWSSDAGVATANPMLTASIGQALKQRRVLLQALVFLVYSGTEVTIGQWNFTLNTEGRGLSPELAGLCNVLFWGSLTLGRFALGFLVDHVGRRRLVAAAIAGVVAGTALFAFAPAPLNVVCLPLLGFALAPIYPTVMSQTPDRLGAYAAHAVGFSVSAAMLGVVALPSVAGLLAETTGLESIATLSFGLALLLGALYWTLERARPS